MKKVKQHGGKRNGAGRPKKEETKVLYRRVPKSMYKACVEAVDKILTP